MRIIEVLIAGNRFQKTQFPGIKVVAAAIRILILNTRPLKQDIANLGLEVIIRVKQLP